jgi:hypothetical protein
VFLQFFELRYVRDCKVRAETNERRSNAIINSEQSKYLIQEKKTRKLQIRQKRK